MDNERYFLSMDTHQINIVCGWTYANCLLNAHRVNCPLFGGGDYEKKFGIFLTFDNICNTCNINEAAGACACAGVFVFVNKNLIAINLS